ncbi:MAG: hypothetical protein COB61_004115 [Thiotrichales bacterium]|nr:hypothetical protein [Thiotrichales bacterium]
MYSDPTKIRTHIVRLRFSDEEHRLIQALTDYTGEQKATLLRQLILEQATDILMPMRGANEGAVVTSLRA